MKELPALEVVMLDAGLVMVEGGMTLPITNWFDGDGEECQPTDAVVIVAGNAQYGWITIEITHEPETVH